jgi:hypothetical protein
MIPLSRSDYLPTFRYRAGQLTTGVLIVAWIACEVGIRSGFNNRSAALLELLYHPGRSWLSLFTSLIVFQNVFSLAINSLFAFVFFPALFDWKRNLLLIPLSFAALWTAGWVFFKIHPYLAIPIPLADAWVGFLLGAVMRSDVWGNVDTFVFGRSWGGLFKVPSYVLLFFWFFYIMIANLFLPEPFSNLPMIYWMPFAAFIQGFFFETILLAVRPKRAK